MSTSPLFVSHKEMDYAGKHIVRGEVFTRAHLRNDKALLDLGYVDVFEGEPSHHCAQCGRSFASEAHYAPHVRGCGKTQERQEAERARHDQAQQDNAARDLMRRVLAEASSGAEPRVTPEEAATVTAYLERHTEPVAEAVGA